MGPQFPERIQAAALMSAMPSAQGALRDPVIRFLAAGSLGYAAWYLLYEFWLHPLGWLDAAVIGHLIRASGILLEGFGYTLIPEPANAENIRTIGVQGGHLLWIGDPCNGLGLFAVFSLFVLAYPGPWRHKAWYVPAGLITIHFINILRIVVLCIVVTIDYELLNFNHDYTFYVVIYGWVFLLWWAWVRFFPNRPAIA